jgi:site-specific DNA-methyltransferase (adenine-specific)
MSNIIQTENFGDYNKYFNINSEEVIEHFLFYPKVRDGKKTGNIHPTKKPVLLMKQLIKLVSIENQTILDPFMGSGSTGVAAKELNRNFIGYEKEIDYFKIAEERLK